VNNWLPRDFQLAKYTHGPQGRESEGNLTRRLTSETCRTTTIGYDVPHINKPISGSPPVFFGDVCPLLPT